ncbi:MAG: restriction endonuclease subunit S, partial [Bacteroidales bacterium]|nr:restriction endonuclease subunit S [Bacteroidales bacterium]
MMVKLGDVVNRVNGNVDRFTTDLQYYIGGEHYDSNELLIQKRGSIQKDINILGFKFHFPFQAKDVIFMSRNPHLRKAGMVNFSGLCSDSSYILRTKNNDVLYEMYLPIILQTDDFWDYCETHKSGGVNFLVNWGTLATYEFELPPITDQKEIADKVWAAYNLKESYKKMIEATDEMVKSRFIEMF